MNHSNTPKRPGISGKRLPVKPIWSPPPKRKAPGLATAGDEKLDPFNLPQGTPPVNADPREKGAQ